MAGSSNTLRPCIYVLFSKLLGPLGMVTIARVKRDNPPNNKNSSSSETETIKLKTVEELMCGTKVMLNGTWDKVLQISLQRFKIALCVYMCEYVYINIYVTYIYRQNRFEKQILCYKDSVLLLKVY